MRTLIATIVVLLSACTSMPALKTNSQNLKTTDHVGLAAQELVKGECGVFFWTLTSPPVFILFQKEGSDHANFLYQGEDIKLDVKGRVVSFQENDVLDITYTRQNAQTLQIKGQFAEMLEGGQRISNASIQMQNPEGWQEIMPVSGVYVCR